MLILGVALVAAVILMAIIMSKPKAKNEKPKESVAESVMEESSVSEPESEKPAESEESKEESSEAEPEEKAASAVDSYKAIAEDAASKFAESNSGEATGVYKYALVQMMPEDKNKTLLLSREVKDGDWYSYDIKTYYFDPDLSKVIEPNEVLSEGAAGMHGMKSIGNMPNGQGLCDKQWAPGTGACTVKQIIRNGDDLISNIVWEGREDQIPAEYTPVTINWKEINGAVNIEDGDVARGGVTAQESAPEEVVATTSNVMRGVIDTYDYNEILALMGQPDPNGDSSAYYRPQRIIRFDRPQLVSARDNTGNGEIRTGEAYCVVVTNEISAPDGSKISFALDPNNLWWPSDASIPLGQPAGTGVELSSIDGKVETAEEKPEEKSGEYVLANSNTTYLSQADIQGMSSRDLRLARNEILARHGRRFKDQELQAYFDSKSWYNGTTAPDVFDANMDGILNEIELANINLIKAEEARR